MGGGGGNEETRDVEGGCVGLSFEISVIFDRHLVDFRQQGDFGDSKSI